MTARTPALAAVGTAGPGDRSPDVFSRLLKDRVILLGSPIDDDVANLVMAELLTLDAEAPGRDISLYVNSPGGSATAMFAVLDTMAFVRSDVATFCVGQAASAAAVILASGARGKRHALPNARVLLHQPHGELQGQSSDLAIHAREFLRQRRRVDEILAERTGQTVERIAADTDRDFILNAEEALAYGVVDRVIGSRALVPVPAAAGTEDGTPPP